ncbi:efflux transporter periplasmic adaptor subunit [Pandoraea capi]|uniref:Efflux transporter periplasmic adaptor subunit n=1 Tax=Pandoraea capi TaxID=2508286 RepID=A0ABY6VMP6_9BURK|nr:efflux RND transporter periplasmic adaptor subunit [Pandoraea capi]VVD66029.1 efflux transporter periplasmic adaptor subunit [Pandoraea capi]
MQRIRKLQIAGAVVVLIAGAAIGLFAFDRSARAVSASVSAPAGSQSASSGASHAHDGADDGHASDEKGAHGDTARASGEAKDHDDEGLVSLSADQQSAAGIEVRAAGAAQIVESTQLPGEVRFNEDRTAHVVARVAGVVERVNVNLGQQVRRGDVLAVISSTQVSEQRAEWLTAQERRAMALKTFEREKSLWEDKISAEQDFLQAQQALREADIALRNARQKLNALGADKGAGGTDGGGLNRFTLRAPFDGTVVAKHAAMGEAVTEAGDLFTISDLNAVWAEIAVPPQWLGAVRVGTPVEVRATAFDSKATGRVSYVGALLGEQTRTAVARVTLDNPQGVWRPGVFVNVALTTSEVTVPVAVSLDAVQTIGNDTMVFVKSPKGFVATPVQTGRRDGASVEIVKGLSAGTEYAASNSFLLKAELGKSTAEHGH